MIKAPAVRFALLLLALAGVAGAFAFCWSITPERAGPAGGNTTSATLAPSTATPSTAAPSTSAPAQASGSAPAGAATRPQSAFGVPAMPDKSAAPDDGSPAFDIARIEPNGETVIAGRAAPGALVELLQNGQVHDRATADPAGEFVLVPAPLPPGTYDLSLRATLPDGRKLTSRQSVAVAIAPMQKERPVVALMVPNQPAVVLSKPASPAAPGTLVIEVVEAEAGGRLHVTGRAGTGATVRLYLNEAYLAEANATAGGRVAFTIAGGVVPGEYRVRLDEVDGRTGTVRARAEVPFSVPETVMASAPASSPQAPAVVASATGQAPVSAAPPTASRPTQPHAAMKTASAGQPQTSDPAAEPAVTASTGTAAPVVVVPKIATTTVTRGDNLWRISRATYGLGVRYSIIYEANQSQIRNPSRIYPGQVFVLPARAQ